jgi:hypothetical protein
VAGILDSKTRVLDTLITSTGRAQIASGELRISYASFSDRQAYYEVGESSGELEDPGSRIYFEACSTDSDLIIPELDSNANLVPFSTDNFTVFGGYVISGSEQQTSVKLYGDAITNDAIESFKRQMILGTRFLLTNQVNDGFFLTPNAATFYESTELANLGDTIVSASLDDVESLWQDYRLTNTPNFQYLPPQNKPLPSQVTGSVMGNYTKINQDPLQSYEEVLNKLENQQSEVFTFSKTRTANDIIGQMFEVSGEKISKLAVVDGGTYEIEGSANPHVFYIGKMYTDTKGTLTFANLFTLVFK